MRPFRSECTCECHTPGMSMRHIAACCKSDPSIEEQAEILAELSQEAYEQGKYDNRCLEGEAVFYLPHTEALVPGHIYSMTGIDEYAISKACEYHFDQWFAEEDGEDDEIEATGTSPF